MYDYKEPCKIKIASALNALFAQAGLSETALAADIQAEIPPRPEMGDLGFPMFGYAKLLRKGPPQIAATVCEILAKQQPQTGDVFFAEGPYVNVRLDRGKAAPEILACVLPGSGADGGFGRPGTLTGQKIMVEFSSPNTNKPLHLGHLRNDALGESVSRILAACGAEIRKVCIINDRGIHICKSMLAYKEHGGGATPESEGVKSDRFVGDWYVAFSKELKAETAERLKQGIPKEDAEAKAPCLCRARELLRKWEAGDGETVALWEKMNGWAVSGWLETYKRTGVSFDKYYYEHDTYLLGKDEILKGLDKGVFYCEADGSVQVDLTAEKLDKKVLLRKDGTSIYITQDIGTAIYRHNDWPFNTLVYVVGSEQQYHFKVLFTILKKLGYDWAKNLYHLSYGMVNLPEGKMKSREGTVVDADDLIDSLRNMALEEIRGKEREDAVGNAAEIAEKIALGALHYFLLQVSPVKDMLFDPNESLSFNGNTGPYLQYMGARISSLLRKAKNEGSEGELSASCCSLLVSGAEWDLIKILAAYSDAVAAAAAGMDPSVLTGYLYELSRAFSRFYHDCPILSAGKAELVRARLALSRAVLRVLRDALHLVCIPFLEVM
ncbi:MAG: arginine--tRNA ligase [Treponema sp.]|nr:arginine--tRNA ligase [Treponema sp.]